MKSTKRFLIRTLLAITLSLSFCTYIYAGLDDYTTLAPLPGTTYCKDTIGPGCKTDFKTYLPGLFNLSIGIAAVLAFIMITWGGIEYMTTDAIGGKEKGRERATQAVYGLLLVIGAYAILYTINPNILNFNLNVEKPAADLFTPTQAASSRGINPITGVDEAAARLYLKGGYNNIDFSGNTNISGLQPNMLSAIEGLAGACYTCPVVITGGAEKEGHTPGSLHYTGNAVDIRPDAKLNAFITNNFTGKEFKECQTYSMPLNGKSTTFLWEPKGSLCGGKVPSGGDHWHASVTP